MADKLCCNHFTLYCRSMRYETSKISPLIHYDLRNVRINSKVKLGFKNKISYFALHALSNYAKNWVTTTKRKLNNSHLCHLFELHVHVGVYYTISFSRVLRYTKLQITESQFSKHDSSNVKFRTFHWNFCIPNSKFSELVCGQICEFRRQNS